VSGQAFLFLLSTSASHPYYTHEGSAANMGSRLTRDERDSREQRDNWDTGFTRHASRTLRAPLRHFCDKPS
jgi:hypothetical protein